MTTTSPSLRRLTPQAAILLLVAAVAWLVTVGRAGSMAGMSGTMGLGLPGFVSMWTLMMAAMMLPSVAPVASMYQQSVRSYRALRLAGFTGGYLLAWVGAGIPALLLTAFVAQLVDDHPGWATTVAVVVFASCGVYQLTPAEVPLPAPLPLTAVAAAALRRLPGGAAGCTRRRPPRAYCLGCCWSLMTLFVVLGVMNLAAMVVLAAVVLAEKPWGHGELLARVVGIAALALATAVIWVPELAPGLHGTSQMMGMAGS
jgi:predicted metal-binding membrane protein